jgi:hypothetical protein
MIAPSFDRRCAGSQRCRSDAIVRWRERARRDLHVDSTLVDSNDAHTAAWQDVWNEFEIRRDFAGIRRLIGMGGDKLLPW